MAAVIPFHDPTSDRLLGPIPSQSRLSEYGLVLKSLGIAYGISMGEDGWYFVIDAHLADRATRALREYTRENENWPPAKRRVRERLPYVGSMRLPIALAVVLAVFFALSGPVADGSNWFAVGTASSEKIAHGEVWRAVTALTLHADSAHLAGNIAGGGVFSWVASRRLGAGRTAMFTLLAGTLGNLANALAHPHGHLSIGASTAVFALVGLLVGTQVRADRAQPTQVARRWTDRVGPWVGGVAILGILGASAKSDLWAHAFGLVAGVVLGLLVARTPERPRRWVQAAYGAGALGLLLGAWQLAFSFPR